MWIPVVNFSGSSRFMKDMFMFNALIWLQCEYIVCCDGMYMNDFL